MIKKISNLNKIIFIFLILILFYLILLIFEIFLDRNLNSQHFHAKFASQNEISFDMRTRFNFSRNFERKNNKKLYQTLWPQEFLNNKKLKEMFIKKNKKKLNYFPLSGIQNVDTLMCNETGNWITYKSDKYGFNNPNNNYDIFLNNNDLYEIDFLLIGDSFVHGVCSEYEKTIAGNFNKLNKKTISLGYGGNGPLSELATIKEYKNLFKSKYILWFYYEGDVDQIYQESLNTILTNYLDPNFSQKLILNRDLINTNLIKLHNKIIFLRTFKLENIRSLFFLSKNTLLNFFFKRKNTKKESYNISPQEINNFVKFEKIIKLAKYHSIESGSKLIFIYLPMFQDKNYNKQKYNIQKKQLLKIIKKLEVKLIDIDKLIFKNNSDPKTLFNLGIYGHYNDDTYSLVAKEIIKYLK